MKPRKHSTLETPVEFIAISMPEGNETGGFAGKPRSADPANESGFLKDQWEKILL